MSARAARRGSSPTEAERFVTAQIAGAEIAFDRSGAAWLASERALVVADLHLEKGSSYAAKGVLLPPYDTRATLERLAALIAAHRPRTVIALGDSFHDADCEARMHDGDVAALRALTRAAPAWIWIEGNHDPQPPAHIGGIVRAEITLGPLTLRHEPSAGPAPGEVAGHLHPCGRISRRGRGVRRRCFATDGARLVMPAFGAYAGGLNVRDEAFAPLFDGLPTAFMLGRDRVYAVAPRHLLSD